MDKKQMLKQMDEIFTYYSVKNQITGQQFENLLQKESFRGLKEGEIKWLHNRVFSSKCFEHMPKNSFGEYETFRMNDTGHELMDTYGSYSEYLKFIKVDNRNKIQHRIFTIAALSLTAISIGLSVYALSIRINNIINTQSNTIQVQKNTIDIYQALLRHDNQIRLSNQ